MVPVEEITRELVQGKLVRIPEGVRILPADPHPKEALLLGKLGQFEEILKHLKMLSSFVIVDLGTGLTPLNQHLLGMFNEFIIIVEPYENSLFHSRSLIDDITSLANEKAGVFVVVNYRQRSDNPHLNVMQIQSYFKTIIEVSLTPAPELYQQASLRHMVASQITLESLTSLQFNTLAEKVELRSRKIF